MESADQPGPIADQNEAGIEDVAMTPEDSPASEPTQSEAPPQPNGAPEEAKYEIKRSSETDDDWKFNPNKKKSGRLSHLCSNQTRLLSACFGCFKKT